MPGHHHRSGGLKQSNKKNKRTKSSKRSISRTAGGKVAGSKNRSSTIAAQSKADRRNSAQQKRNTKRQELLRQKRGIGSSLPPPRIVGVVSLGSSADIEENVRAFILGGADKVLHLHEHESATATCKFEVHKKAGNLTVLTSNSAFRQGDGDDSYVAAALDLARICDTMLFVVDAEGSSISADQMEINIGEESLQSGKSTYGIDWSHLIGERGDRILTAIKTQGLPTPLTVLAQTSASPMNEMDDMMTIQSMKSLRRSCVKRNLDLKRYVSRFATTEFGKGNDKVVEIDLTLDDASSSSANLVRTLCSMSCSAPKWVSNMPRSYLLSDSYSYDKSSHELSITGFIRGKAPFDINSLVHVPEVGTFACKNVKLAHNPLMRQNVTDAENSISPDKGLQESLDMFASPDSLDGEQNLVGFEDEPELNDETPAPEFERPAGWSDYQSSWIDAVDKDGFDEEIDRGELARELNQKRVDMDDTVAPDDMDLEEANEISPEERKSLMELRREKQAEDLEFPDEVQVDEDQLAQDRFARYRSMKSFRNSQWDPKESLPDSYSSLYHFSSFKATQRSVMNDMKELVTAADSCAGGFFGKSPQTGDTMNELSDDEDDFLVGCVPSGTYVTLTLGDVSPTAISGVASASLLVGVSLLAHENKISVLHMGLSQPTNHDQGENNPVQSKDVLTFRCGWRTWEARPVFSQNNLNCGKHKFERFLPQGAHFVASVFGPVTYTPCPVLMFRKNEKTGSQELVAAGTMLGADADRIVLKRIILTGYPVRVHKRHATIKYMFYSPEDVKWFKPAELYTKHGLQGNIIQSIGEHGTMKCLFNAPVKQHDTVCLPLYKRIYPKFVQKEGDKRHGGMTYRESNSLIVR